jgi:hypothetical protein
MGEAAGKADILGTSKPIPAAPALLPEPADEPGFDPIHAILLIRFGV